MNLPPLSHYTQFSRGTPTFSLTRIRPSCSASIKRVSLTRATRSHTLSQTLRPDLPRPPTTPHHPAPRPASQAGATASPSKTHGTRRGRGLPPPCPSPRPCCGNRRLFFATDESTGTSGERTRGNTCADRRTKI